MSLIVHIGLGKTATTTLQKHVFPLLKEDGAIAEFNPRSVHQRLKRAIHTWTVDEALRRDIARLPAGTILSQEALSGWNPATWSEYLEFNKALFPRKSIILITMREPVSYLTSVYQQLVHQGNVIPPSLFFQPADSYPAIRNVARTRMCEVFSIDDFMLSNLVDMYAAHFARVVVVPLESIGKMDFLDALMDIDAGHKARAVEAFATAPRRNQSYSRRAMWLTFKRDAVFGVFGARSAGFLDDLLGSFDAKPNRRNRPSSHWRSHVLGLPFPTWRYLMQYGVDRVLPYRKYRLPQGQYLGRGLADNVAFYEALQADGLAQRDARWSRNVESEAT